MARPKTLAEFFSRRNAPTQSSVAERLGISEAHMSRLARGQAQPSLGLAVRISEHTGVPVEALLAIASPEAAAS